MVIPIPVCSSCFFRPTTTTRTEQQATPQYQVSPQDAKSFMDAAPLMGVLLLATVVVILLPDR